MNCFPQPSELTGDLMGSPLRNSELEQIATNIRKIANIRSNKWDSFTWESYKTACTHRVTAKERDILNDLSEMGYLSFDDEKYYFTSKAIALYMLMSEPVVIDPSKPVMR